MVRAQRTAGCRPILEQLLRAAASVGANLEEAKAASTRREFVRMCSIALRECREATYWLRLAVETGVLPPEATPLRAEGEELARIIGPIIVAARRNLSASG
jgi:four helix bundle protein